MTDKCSGHAADPAATPLNFQSWFRRLRSSPRSQLKLFCFPYAGGDAMSIYHSWRNAFPVEIEVFAAQLPGRGARVNETPLTRLEPLVERLAHVMRPQLNGPFALFGHSMGALICFELARLLRAQCGISPAHLFVSGCRAPHLRGDQPITYSLPDAEFVEELQRLNGTPLEVFSQPELLELVLPLLRADFELCQIYSYVPGPLFECPITAFGGLDDEITREEVSQWAQHTTKAFDLRMLPGDHFFIRRKDATVAQIVSAKCRWYMQL